jgi:hypothetical protein
MKNWKWTSALIGAVILAGCGGGKDAGTAPFGNGDTTAASVANVVLQLSKTSVTNSGSDGVDVTVTTTDANNNVVADAPVTIAADTNAIVIADSPTTDTTGKVTAAVAVGTDNRSNRTVTITATSGSVTKTATFQVIGAKVKSTLVPSQLTTGGQGSVQYVVTDVNSNPMVNQPITITAFGSTTSGTTNNQGAFTYSYTAPATAGDYIIKAVAAGASPDPDDKITVTAAGTTPPPVTPNSIKSASIQVTPSVVTVNTVANPTTNQTAVRALFIGTNNAPIAGVRARFDLAGDANSIGGTFTPQSDLNPILYSNAAGEVNGFYIPATRFSPTDGVTIRVCYGYVDSDVANGACPNFQTTTLTVASEAISVSIGTDRKLIDNTLTYIQEFVVTVVDSAGNAKSDVVITPSLDILRFGKGQWNLSASVWVINPVQWFRSLPDQTPWYLEDPRPLSEQVSDPSGAPLIDPSAACWNEDRNRNGVLEADEDSKTNGYSISAGGNGNGKLDPRASDIAVSIVGSNKTDASGKVTVRIEYAKNLGSWLEYKILVSAGGVSGTQGRATWTDVLEVLDADTKGSATPAFAFSPYGVVAGCNNPN